MPGDAATTVIHVHVRCPLVDTVPVPARAPDDLHRLASITQDVSASTLERDLASALIAARPAGSRIPFERFLNRPASEPALLSMWDELVGDLNVTRADRVVSRLLGESLQGRKGGAVGAISRAGRQIVYPDPAYAAGWINRVAAEEQAIGDPFACACHAYAEVALSHPYGDGNGRLARAMFQRALARAGLLHAPLIPLGPLIYLNHKSLIAVLVRLGTVGDWLPFLDVMAQLTTKALAFTEHRLKAFAPEPGHANPIP